MKKKTLRKYNSVLLTGLLSTILAVGAIGVTATMTTTKGDFSANAYESSYQVDTSKIGTGKTYYVSPDGKEENMDNSSPENRTSIAKLLVDRTILKPGDKIVVAPGTYRFNDRLRAYASGDTTGYITVINEDPTQKAVLDFSGQVFDGNNRGVQIDGDFWYWYGVDICGAGDNGMYIGGSYNVIENCEFYNNRDTGLQLGRSEGDYSNITQWPSYNLIKNCTSYNNYDNETYGENADGFAAKLTVGYGNIFDGCIAYRNSDDGWDLYAKADSGNIGAVIMYNCVAFENGYLGETQEAFNAKCGYTNATTGEWVSTYNTKYNEAVTQSYLTRDGDGNGFKLGGSIMEGDVFLYNCMSFNNRMHGITDNSNPGVLSINNVTCYNNAAGIDNDPTSPNFGNIDFNATIESCNNIDLARQTYSYNVMGGMLSVQDVNKNLGADRYRGSLLNSVLLDAMYNSVTITDVVDASSFSEAYAVKGTSGAQIPTSVFAKVPTVDVLNGINGNVVNNTVHDTCRNADGSINMGEILKIVNYNALYDGATKDTIGAYLIGESWDDYTHYDYVNASHSADKNWAAVDSAHATLNLNTNVNATYQDFDLTTVMKDVTITWSSNNEDIIKIEEGKPSVSGTIDARAIVYRTANDEKVTLTATITRNGTEVSKQRNFEVVVKADVPTIGEAVLTGVEDGMRIDDRYDNVAEPKFTVTNAADYNGKLLSEDLYTVETQYLYASSKTETPIEIAKVTSSVPGVYTINKTVTLKSDGSMRSFSYMIYVAGRSANIQFMEGTEAINVNRYGFTVAGELSSPSGKIYTVVSDTQLTDVTPEKVMAEGIVNEFRAMDINIQYEKDNNSNYYIYYVLGNLNGDATSQVKEIPVQTVEIATVADFKSMLLENNSSTIYVLTNDIDLSGESNWKNEITNSKVNFRGLLNGKGHTIKGLTVSESKENEIASLFYRLDGGTIENVKFEDITIEGVQKVGLIATSYGGYIYNVSMKNVKVSGGIRIGGLIGQVLAGETNIDQVSYVVDRTYTKATSVVASDFDANTFYTKDGDNYVKAEEFVEGTEYYTLDAGIKGDRMGAIVGFIQASSASDWARTYISNCYVENVFGTGGEQYCASVVGRYDDRNAKDYLYIENCYSTSIMRATKYQGGIIGGQTGAGVLRVNNCIFTGELYYAGNLATKLYAALKNCSGIMGYYAGNADTIITNCFAPLQEYNTNYDVDMSEILLGRIEKSDFWNSKSKYDLETCWTLLDATDGIIPAPYVTLNFLGDWN